MAASVDDESIPHVEDDADDESRPEAEKVEEEEKEEKEDKKVSKDVPAVDPDLPTVKEIGTERVMAGKVVVLKRKLRNVEFYITTLEDKSILFLTAGVEGEMCMTKEIHSLQGYDHEARALRCMDHVSISLVEILGDNADDAPAEDFSQSAIVYVYQHEFYRDVGRPYELLTYLNKGF